MLRPKSNQSHKEAHAHVDQDNLYHRQVAVKSEQDSATNPLHGNDASRVGVFYK